jgi:hypothetical protein
VENFTRERFLKRWGNQTAQGKIGCGKLVQKCEKEFYCIM